MSRTTAHAGSHSIGDDERWHWQRIFLYWRIPHSVFVCVCVCPFPLCLMNSQAIRPKKKKEKQLRSQTHFTSSHPFTRSGCWHATQLVTAWITLHEGLRGENHTGNPILCHIKCQGGSFRCSVITTETAGGEAEEWRRRRRRRRRGEDEG